MSDRFQSSSDHFINVLLKIIHKIWKRKEKNQSQCRFRKTFLFHVFINLSFILLTEIFHRNSCCKNILLNRKHSFIDDYSERIAFGGHFPAAAPLGCSSSWCLWRLTSHLKPQQDRRSVLFLSLMHFSFCQFGFWHFVEMVLGSFLSNKWIFMVSPQSICLFLCWSNPFSHLNREKNKKH